MWARYALAALSAVILTVSVARADRLVVVELFTSQGCSSCPPADALLGELTARDDVLPLALHVDYWDYIGWKDGFADPAYTERQRGYARTAGSTSIFTPQMVVGGQDHVVGYKPMKLADLIMDRSKGQDPVAVDAARNGDRLTISVVARPGQAPALRGADIVLVRYSPAETVKIRRGENAGRTLTYHNIVREMRLLDRWTGQGRFQRQVTVPAGPDQYAVLVQIPKEGPILAAAKAR